MTVLLNVPLTQGGAQIVVEADRADIAEKIALAAPTPGQAVAKASRTLTESLTDLQPLLQTIKDTLVASGPDEFTVEFGIKLGGETGIIIAKGTAEVNLTVTMSWQKHRTGAD